MIKLNLKVPQESVPMTNNNQCIYNVNSYLEVYNLRVSILYNLRGLKAKSYRSDSRPQVA